MNGILDFVANQMKILFSFETPHEFIKVFRISKLVSAFNCLMLKGICHGLYKMEVSIINTLSIGFIGKKIKLT